LINRTLPNTPATYVYKGCRSNLLLQLMLYPMLATTRRERYNITIDN